MNISLTNELEEFVREKVASGRYLTASEVVREALRLLEERDRLHELRLKQLQGDINLGLEQLERGESDLLDIESIKARGRQHLAGRRR
ncbi:type II toxin-antitoxin system ParD family antitoxin [Tautonia sociabilis]|uniref:Type II toxin-antitoxin system ParD family antitoxin n=1 Tax=Tautonia sociabilis TaxID=2080755 RepID=A0A432MI21_9BACT|nr:type II toxin-antitoxin system ParD family antitoxin [Tautonia sociabilis]RUL86979.1 type II toxin-antitoxin system ParD family antitoxin [Tautonia sociabilis]